MELGFPKDAVVDVGAMRARVLADLERGELPSRPGHRLVAEHSVIMDPAYVHITQASIAEHRRLSDVLRGHGVHSIGRYGMGGRTVPTRGRYRRGAGTRGTLLEAGHGAP